MKGGERAMTGWAGLDRLLAVDPADAGCDHAMDLLHVYAELLAVERDAARHHPEVAAHLAACGPCAEDLAGLLAALRPPPA
jgi:hypothetical protein